MFVPIFEKDGNKLFVLRKDFSADNEDDARKIGFGAAFVEAILMDMKFTNSVMDIDITNTPHRRAEISGVPVAVISGPLFEEVKDGVQST